MAKVPRDRFAGLFVLPKQRRTTIDAFVEVADSYLKALTGSTGLAASLATTADAIVPQELIGRARAVFQPRLDELYGKVRALKTCSNEVTDLLDKVIDGLDALASWSAEGSAMTAYAFQRRAGGSVPPWVGARARVEDAVRRLGRLAPLLRAAEPLTDAQQRVWDALDSHALSTKDLVKLLGGHDTEDRIRQIVKAIRATGRIIDRRGNRGYFRPDRPPPS